VGLKDFFTSSGRAKGRLARQIKTITNPYTQSADRYNAMEQLLEDASDEAYVGLLRRFTMTSTKSIEDEEEKGWVYRRLSAIGKPILPALRTFCLEHENIAWALRIVEDVANEEEEWGLLEALLERHPPGYERDPAKKIQLLTHLADIEDGRISGILARYLDDPDETVRFFAVEALVDIGDAASVEPLVDRLCNAAEDSVRLRTRILDGLASHGWDISAHRARLAPQLGHEHGFDQNKVVRR
jgi:HEAT repeat protein